MSTTPTQQSQDEMVKTMKLMMDVMSTHSEYLHMITDQLKRLQIVFQPLELVLQSLLTIEENTSSLKPPTSPIVMEKTSGEKDSVYGNEKNFLPELPTDEYDTNDENTTTIGQLTSPNIVQVLSSKGGLKTYSVNIAYGTCTCPDYQYRHADTHTCCKHLMKVMDNQFLYGINDKKVAHLQKMCKCK